MRRHAKAIVAASALLLLTLALGSTQALAAKSTVGTFGSPTTGTTGGLFSTPAGVAINRTGNGGVPAGTFYVADQKNNRVQRFGPTRAFVSAFGWDTIVDGSLSDPGKVKTFQVCAVAGDCQNGIGGAGAGQFGSSGMQGIAVDQATGNVFVSDQSDRRISVFGSTGVFQGAFGWGALDGTAALQFCTTLTGCNAPAGTGSAAGQFGGALGGLDVDASGNLYVANKTGRRVDVFKLTLSGPASNKVVTGVEFLRAFGWGVDTNAAAFEVCTVASECNAGATTAPGNNPGQFGTATTSPTDVAVDASRNVYALDVANKRIQKFDATPALLTSTFGSAALSSAFGTGNLYKLSYDAAADHLYVSGSKSTNGNKVVVAELDSSGASIDTHGADLTVTAATGLAAAPASIGGSLYLTSAINNVRHGGFVLNDTTPAMDPVTVHTGTTATFSGTVVSNGIDVNYHFEYATGVGWIKFPVNDVAAGSAPGTIAVSQDVTGLTGSQSYNVRLVANRPLGGGSVVSPPVSFTTGPASPAISNVKASGKVASEAVLGAAVNPQNQATTYHFEYGTADCASSSCLSAPVAEENIGAGGVPVAVSQEIKGLESDTTYHFRVLATNPSGTSASPDRTFKTYPDSKAGEPGQFPGQGFLPDGRAWEMVSPPDKNGGFMYGKGPTTIVSPDGDRVGYAATANYGDTKGTGVLGMTQYVATRDGDGWHSHAITPTPNPGINQLLVAPTAAFFSPDLTRATIAGYDMPGAEGDIPDGLSNLYRTTISDGSLDAMTTPLNGPVSTQSLTVLAGGSTDYGHVVFESTANLLPGTSGFGFKLYEWDEGTLRLVGVLPDGSVAEESRPPETSEGDPLVDPQAFSADGSRLLFISPAESPVRLYMRKDHTSTVLISESEGSIPVAEPEAVRFEDASPDLSKVAFSTTSVLTDEDPGGPGYALYVYTDSANPASDQNLRFVARFVIGPPTVAGMSVDANRGFVYDEGPQQLKRWDESGAHLLVDVSGSSLARHLVRSIESTVNVSDDARRIAFLAGEGGPLTDSPLGLKDSGPAFLEALYLYDTETDTLVCASCPANGDPTTGDTFVWPEGTEDAHFGQLTPPRFMSSDGSRVFFTTVDPLVAEDTNGMKDAYEYDLATGAHRLISSGRSPRDSWFASASRDADDVFFLTKEALSGWDVDTDRDLYDARVGGGLPEPAPVPPSCQGDACQPPPTELNDPTPASSSFRGEGDAIDRPGRRNPRCAKGKRRVRTRDGKARCIKRPVVKHSKRTAKHDRRAGK